MEKQEFIKTLERMVKFYSSHENFLPAEYMEGAVERWVKVHPVKTRQREFLKQFPDARVDSQGRLCACPMNIDKNYNCEDFHFCDECREEYWNKEIE